MNKKTSLNSFFDKVYVITCNSFFDRQSYIKDHFYKNNIEFDFFVSIDHKLLTPDTISNTNMSLALSHLYCVIDAKLNGYKSILICEDDVNFVENVQLDFQNFINVLPDTWNFIQLGNQFWAEKWLKRTYISENLYEFKWGTGSHCIGINSNMFSTVIDAFQLFDDPIDFMYYKLFEKYKCYCTESFLADSLSKTDHLNHYDTKHIFNSTIDHKNI